MRVVVTGLGLVSPLGVGSETTFAGLLAGRCAIGDRTLFELPGCRVDVAAEVVDPRLGQVAPASERRSWSRADAMAVWAAAEALRAAGADDRACLDLFVGGTTSGMLECERLLAELTARPDGTVDEEVLFSHPLTAPADRIHQRLGPFRRVRTLCSACSGGAAAIIAAARAIVAGRTERALAGGVDGLCRLTFSGFAALGALDRRPCRPFDRRRAGLSLGEGAAFLLLESAASARRRGVAPIAELAGWAMAAEAHHPTHPEPDGATATAVMAEALRRGGRTAGELDYVNAHGTATIHNDAMECRALQNLLGAARARTAVSSSKGHIGHTLGAAGAIEAAITCLVLQHGVAPPTVGLEEVDPACELYHLRQAAELDVRVALSNSFGFGGTDAALLFVRPGQPRADEPPRWRPVAITGGASVGPLGLGGIRLAAGYADPAAAAPPVEPAPVPLDLDPRRARRFDRAARLTTAAVERALAEARFATPDDLAHRRIGALVGSAFGSVGSTGRYLVKLFDKGARFASPALFPGALPSALGSSASIYLGLRGPVLSTADLAVSGEGALVGAVELVAGGEADVLVAAAVEERSEVAARVSGPLCSGIDAPERRGEGAAALVVEALDSAVHRGAPIAALVAHAISWRGSGAAALAELPPPPARAAVYRSHRTRAAAPLPAPWLARPQRFVSDRAGLHESAGGIAAVAALAAIADGELDAALLLGLAPDRGHALLLEAPSQADGADGA